MIKEKKCDRNYKRNHKRIQDAKIHPYRQKQNSRKDMHTKSLKIVTYYISLDLVKKTKLQVLKK